MTRQVLLMRKLKLGDGERLVHTPAAGESWVRLEPRFVCFETGVLRHNDNKNQ